MPVRVCVCMRVCARVCCRLQRRVTSIVVDCRRKEDMMSDNGWKEMLKRDYAEFLQRYPSPQAEVYRKRPCEVTTGKAPYKQNKKTKTIE